MGEGLNLERLNLRTPKAYNFDDESETVPPRIKFYCVSEGPTEESYLFGIRNNKTVLKIKNDVHIEVVEKEEGQETLSHPMQLVNACLRAMGRIDENGDEVPENKWIEYCKWKDFDASIDKVCVIFDKDTRKLESVIDEIFELCNKYKIEVVMSNPNFELWLLMHFPNIKQYPEEMLLENKKNLRYQLFENESKNKKYLEILVAKSAEGYKKGSKINFDKFLPLVDSAIQQAKLFTEDSKLLITKLGTSMGMLIEEMRL